jgi:hypothetical protein
MDWLKTLCPTIATAIGGPLGGLAYEAVSKVLGVSQEDAKSMLESGKLSAEQLASVQQAEIALKAKAQELGLNFEQLAVQDRKSARDMQISTHSFIPPTLAILIVLVWSATQYFMFTHIIPDTMREMVSRVLGTMDGALMLVLSFYFGSSSGSQAKDQMLGAKK